MTLSTVEMSSKLRTEEYPLASVTRNSFAELIMFLCIDRAGIQTEER